MRAGRVVYVYSNQGWRIARVVDPLPEGRPTVEHPEGETQVYSRKRIARVSEHTARTTGELRAYAEYVEQLKGQADLAALWETLREEAVKEPVAMDELALLALPPASVAASDAMAWALFDDSVYFKQRKTGGWALNAPRVVDERLRRIEAEARERRDMEAMSEWVRSPSGRAPPEASRAVSALEELVLYGDGSKLARLGGELIRAAFPDSGEAEPELAWSVLVELGIFGPNENLALLRAGLPTTMPEEVQAAAERLAATPMDTSRYTDHRELLCVAIDDRFTTEVDDALAFMDHGDGTRTVWILITDAAELVPADSLVDAEARRRGATLYAPEGKVPMLPEVLCDGVASLRPGMDQPVLAFQVVLDAVGEVIDFDVEEAVVHISRRLTYPEVDDLLAKPAGSDPLASTLHGLLHAADQRRDRRFDTGAITLDRREVAVHVEGDGSVHTEPYRTDDPSRRLVAEWMITACHQAAEWCRDREIPAVYRGQDPPAVQPTIPRDRALAGHELHRILRTMRKATLRSEPSPHAGLGVPCYTQVTSPLRRYQDLLMHRQLKHYLRRGAPALSSDDLMATFSEVEELQASRSLVERESRRYWQLKALEPRVGEELDAEVLREAGRRMILELLGTGLQVAWHPDAPVHPGDRFPVRLRAADARRDRLVVERRATTNLPTTGASAGRAGRKPG